MARKYTRPELSAEDIELFQPGKCVMINPSLADVALALKKTEKGCRKNKLPLHEAQEAWQSVNDQQALGSGAGEWSCSARFKYGLQGTVFQAVRLSEELVGLFCDRQEVKPGESSSFPVPVFDEQDKQENLTLWLSSVLQVFWMYLSDDEIDQIEQDYVQRVMLNAAISEEKEAIAKARKKELRKKILDSLFRGVVPGFVSIYQESCMRIARELREEGTDNISWNQLKKTQQSLVAKYQPELVQLVENNTISIEKLESVKDKTPYIISFSLWTGMQRLFHQPQIALGIRNPVIHREFNKLGGEHKAISDKLKKTAGVTCHPGTATTIGWLRIHVDDENKLCFVDEVQSDTLEAARQIDNDAANEFLKQCSDWHIHGFATIYQWARDIGYQVAIHSRESAAEKPGMTTSDRKWNTYYRPIIKRFGLKEVSVDDYPAKIWVQPE